MLDSRYFQGLIDEVAYYPSVLSAARREVHQVAHLEEVPVLLRRRRGAAIDLPRRTVLDRNGVLYPLAALAVAEDGVYYARPIEGNEHFVYQERWILPAPGWVINRFAFRAADILEAGREIHADDHGRVALLQPSRREILDHLAGDRTRGLLYLQSITQPGSQRVDEVSPGSRCVGSWESVGRVGTPP